MSLEDKIHENTLALQQLTEAVNRLAAAGSSTPAPAASPTPVPAAAPVESPTPTPAAAPAQPVDLDALRDKLKKLFTKSPSTGGKILSKFGVPNISSLSPEQLPEFASAVDAALQGN